MCARRDDRLAKLAQSLEHDHRRRRSLFRAGRPGPGGRRKGRRRPAAGMARRSRSWSTTPGSAADWRSSPRASSSDWEEMIDTNVKGLLYVSRAVIPGMVERGRGHVINIGSIAGHEVYPGGERLLRDEVRRPGPDKGLRLDLNGTPIRVSEVAPGMVETEFSLVRFHGDAERAGKVYQGLTPLSPDDIADAVVWCATRPPTSTSARSSSCPRPRPRRPWSTGHRSTVSFLMRTRIAAWGKRDRHRGSGVPSSPERHVPRRRSGGEAETRFRW